MKAVSDGVISAIKAGYPELPVYEGNTEQGISEPCFSVLIVNPTQSQELGARFHRVCPVCVYYFPSADAEYSDIDEVIEKLFSILIVIDGDFRGSNMTASLVEGVVTFRVDYDYFVRQVEADTETMNTLEMRENAHE